MKVLFLNNFYYPRGGSERVLFEEMRMLREAGHETAVFTRSDGRNLPSPHEKFFPRAIQRDTYSVSLEGVRTVQEMVYSFSARRGLVRLLEAFKPDIAHAHNIYGGLSTAVLDTLRKGNVPVVMTLHDLKLLCPSYLMLNHGRVCELCKDRRFYHAVRTKCHKDSYLASAIYATESYFSSLFGKYDSVKRFIAPSRFLLNKHREFGHDTGRFVHIPNPAAALIRLPVSREEGRHLLYIGRLSREKGIGTMLSAYRSTKTDLPLVIAGEGPYRREAEELAAKAPNMNVTFTGHLAADALEQAIDAARAVIVPSESYENAPMAIVESFSRGKPVVGARIGGIPEMIEDGVNGYLFEPGNAGDLREKLEVLLALPGDQIEGMGRAARIKVEREYSAALHYERLMETYRQVLRYRYA